MSAYYTRWCKEHGEWSMDIDNPSECPECIKLGLTEVQRLRRKVLDLETELTGCQITIKEITKRHDNLFNMDAKIITSLNDELTNLKLAFAKLQHRVKEEGHHEPNFC